MRSALSMSLNTHLVFPHEVGPHSMHVCGCLSANIVAVFGFSSSYLYSSLRGRGARPGHARKRVAATKSHERDNDCRNYAYHQYPILFVFEFVFTDRNFRNSTIVIQSAMIVHSRVCVCVYVCGIYTNVTRVKIYLDTNIMQFTLFYKRIE